MGQDVLRSLTPAQQVVRIVRDEMIALFGDAGGGLQPTSVSPRVILLLGLQGSGKTTTAGKLGTWLARQGRHPMLVSTDVRRPAAIEQLNVLGQKASLRVFDPPGQLDPVRRAGDALSEAKNLGFDVVIVDTAGRLHIDDDLMTELQAIKAAVSPSDLIYVADAMTGQDAIKSAGEFHRRDRRHRRDARASSTATRAAARRSRSSRSWACRSRSSAAASASRTSSRSTPTAWCRGCSAWATCSRSSRGPSRRSTSRTRRGSRRRSGTTTSRSRIFADQLRTIRKMGPLESILGMIPGLGESQAAGREQAGRAAAGADRGDHRLDDAGRAAPTIG